MRVEHTPTTAEVESSGPAPGDRRVAGLGQTSARSEPAAGGEVTDSEGEGAKGHG
jgi:hypothetical protein